MIYKNCDFFKKIFFEKVQLLKLQQNMKCFNLDFSYESPHFLIKMYVFAKIMAIIASI